MRYTGPYWMRVSIYARVPPLEFLDTFCNPSLMHPLDRGYLMDETEIAITQVGVACTYVGMRLGMRKERGGFPDQI